MIRFITKILLVSVFFIGLGAIADGILQTVTQTKNDFVFEQKSECNKSKLKVVKFESSEQGQYQFRMMLPNFDEPPNHEVTFEKPIAQKKVVILHQHESVE